MAMSRVESSTVDFVAAPAVPRPRRGKLCVAIQGSTPAEIWERAATAAGETRFLEFRLDALAKPAAALPGLQEFLASHREVSAIATCRRKQFGGHFVGTLTAELEVLLKAAESGCSIVDLEVESAEEAKPAQLGKFRTGLRAAGASLLISYPRLYAHQGPGAGSGPDRGLRAGFREGGLDRPHTL